MKLPKVGEKFYWKDLDGIIHEEICLKIEEEDNPDLETMFFTYITENGSGEFVSEEAILDSDSDEVKDFKKEQTEKKIKEISKLILDPEVHDTLVKKLSKEHEVINIINILNTLASYD